MKDSHVFYRRNLPHYHPAHATFFITFRLAGSLPAEVIARLKEERRQDEKLLLSNKDRNTRRKEIGDLHKRYFANFDTLLDKAVNSPSWLRDEHVANMVAEAMHFRDKKVYDLLAYCIMPNHVHMVFAVERSGTSLYKILQSLKSYTAREANKLLDRSGAFWQHESYDHVVRDGKELKQVVNYVLYNPVKAGLVSSYNQWKWSYVQIASCDEPRRTTKSCAVMADGFMKQGMALCRNAEIRFYNLYCCGMLFSCRPCL